MVAHKVRWDARVASARSTHGTTWSVSWRISSFLRIGVHCTKEPKAASPDRYCTILCQAILGTDARHPRYVWERQAVLFYFWPWVQTELQRQRVQDLASAMAAAERLTYFTPTDGGKNKGQPQHKEQSPEPSKAKSEGASKSFSSRKDSSHSRSTGSSSNHPKSFSCFLCGGQHTTFVPRKLPWMLY